MVSMTFPLIPLPVFDATGLDAAWLVGAAAAVLVGAAAGGAGDVWGCSVFSQPASERARSAQMRVTVCILSMNFCLCELSSRGLLQAEMCVDVVVPSRS